MADRPIDAFEGSARAPRYRQLEALLRRDIARGKYPVGSLLPAEWDLASLYSVSRHTVREATRRLVEAGMLARRQGVGTQVKARESTSRFVASLSSLPELFQYTQRTRLKVIAEETFAADAKTAELLRTRVGSRWTRFDTCRYPIGARTPISYTEIYVQAGHDAIRAEIEGESVWMFGLVERHYGERIVEVLQEVGAVTITPRIAGLVGAKAGAAGLHVIRYYLGAGERLLSVSVNVYPENRFKFSTRWRMRDQADPAGA